MKEKLLKLAKMLIKFTITEVGDVKWVHEGEFIEGVEVYIEDENGEMIPVADGEYVKDEVKIVVKDGKIDSFEPVEEKMEEEPIKDPVDEPKEDEKVTELEAKIAELEGIIAGKDELIETLTTENEELRKQLDKPLEEPVKMNATPREKHNTDNKALKYFQN